MTSDSKAHVPSFPSTHWSEIARLQGAQQRTEILDRILQRYQPALRAHLILKRRVRRDDADDLLQSFITDKVLERDLFARADREKGRFRSLLLKSLENFVADSHRRDRTQQRALGNRLSLDSESARGSGVLSVDDSDVFDVAWARTVVGRTMERMQSDCQARDREAIWQVFTLRVLGPVLRGEEAVSHSEIAARCGFESSIQAANALVVAKRQFRRTLADVVAEYSPDTASIEQEIAELRRIVQHSDSIDFKSLLESGGVAAGGDSSTAISDHESLQNLLDLEASPGNAPSASDDEWAELLDDFLGSPIESALRLMSDPDGDGFEAARQAAAGSQIERLYDVFNVSQPPLELLTALKRSARRTTHEEAERFPTEIAGVVYFSSIALALTRLGQRITRLEDDALRDGLRLTLARPWLNETVRSVLQSALDEL